LAVKPTDRNKRLMSPVSNRKTSHTIMNLAPNREPEQADFKWTRAEQPPQFGISCSSE
jgi:hypothetical protein